MRWILRTLILCMDTFPNHHLEQANHSASSPDL
jgi:hypothetical protein